MLPASLARLHVAQVVAVHGQHQIEATEVIQFDLPGAAWEVNAPSFGRGTHAWVGLVAHMPAAGTGGVNDEVIGQALLLDEMKKHSFRCW